MHILLINPRAQKAHRRLPLSLLFVARGIPKDFTWEIVDANIEADASDRALRIVANNPADTIVLMTVMPGPQLRWAVPWLRTLKQQWPDVPVIWGGYFPTVHPDVVVRDPHIDVVVIGQGEQTLAEVLPALRDGGIRAVSGIDGTVCELDGAIIRGEKRAAQISSRLGPVDDQKVDMERYAAQTFLGQRTFNHHSSVGCPYVCVTFAR